MNDSANLFTRFRAALAGSRTETIPSGDALEPLLERAVAQARAAWPRIPYPPEIFVADLAARLPADTSLAAHLDTLPAADVYLAYACARALPAAIRAFEEHLIPVIRPALARIGAQPDAIAEVEQRLRERLLVGTADRPPAAGTYAGFGALAAWVRVSALREYYGLAREGQRWQQLEDDELTAQLDDAAPGVGSELGFLKAQYRPHFRAALTEAMTCLDARERNLLRQHYLDGLQVDQLGALYRVHRVTASRWLAAARNAVLAHTRRLLVARLDIDADEFDSIVRLIRSQLDLSLRTHLRQAEDHP
jgi:RNA polymerase sigma-70 factor (ECF subfamily)